MDPCPIDEHTRRDTASSRRVYLDNRHFCAALTWNGVRITRVAHTHQRSRHASAVCSVTRHSPLSTGGKRTRLRGVAKPILLSVPAMLSWRVLCVYAADFGFPADASIAATAVLCSESAGTPLHPDPSSDETSELGGHHVRRPCCISASFRSVPDKHACCLGTTIGATRACLRSPPGCRSRVMEAT